MKIFYVIFLLAVPVLGSATSSTKPPRECKVNLDIPRITIPPTPNNANLPTFGQKIIGWGTGPEGAQTKLENLSVQDIQDYQEKEVDFLMVKAWYDFYKNETIRNPCNPTAPIRAELMLKIMTLWEKL